MSEKEAAAASPALAAGDEMPPTEPRVVRSTGLYSCDEQGRHWLNRRVSVAVDVSGCEAPTGAATGGAGHLALLVRLFTGNDNLYRRFPFNVEVLVDDRVVRVVEFSREYQEKAFSLPVPANGIVEFSLVSELAAVPAEIGLGPDKRELSVMAAFSAVPGPADTGIAARPAQLGSWVQSVVPTVEELPRPVFVVGMYRSGTSVLTWAIGQHPNLWALEETGWFPVFSNGLLAAWKRAAGAKRSFSSVYELQEQQFYAFFGQALDKMMKSLSKEHAMRVLLGRLSGHEPLFVPQLQILRALGSSKQRWVDGTPENSMVMGQLRRLFPNAKFIHIVRRPLEVLASMAHFERMGGSAAPPREALDAWQQRVSRAYLAERAFGSDVVMRVRYTDLVAEPKETLRGIFEFLGEPDFDTAAETFEVRLNSSKVTPDEVKEIETELGWELGDAMQLYLDASEPLAAPLQPDSEAQCRIQESLDDATARLLGLFS